MSRDSSKAKDGAAQSLPDSQDNNQTEKTVQTLRKSQRKLSIHNSNLALTGLNVQDPDPFQYGSKAVKKKAPRKKRPASTSPKTGLDTPNQDTHKELRLKPPPLLTPELSLKTQETNPQHRATTRNQPSFKNCRDATTTDPAQRCKNVTLVKPTTSAISAQNINKTKHQAIDSSQEPLYKLGPRKRTPTFKAKEASHLVLIAPSAPNLQNQVQRKIIPSQRSPEHDIPRRIARITSNTQTQTKVPLSLSKRPAPKPSPQHTEFESTAPPKSLPPGQFRKNSSFTGFSRNRPISPKSLLKPGSATFRPGALSTSSFPSPLQIPLPLPLNENKMAPLSGFVRAPEPAFLSRPIVAKKMPAPGTMRAQRGTTKKYGKTAALEMAPMPRVTSTETRSTPLTFIPPSTPVSAVMASEKKLSRDKKQANNASLQQSQPQTKPTRVLGVTKSKVTKMEIPQPLVPLVGSLSSKPLVPAVKAKSQKAKSRLPSPSSTTSSKLENGSRSRHKSSIEGKRAVPATFSVQEQQAKQVRDAVAQAEQDALTSKVARLYPRTRGSPTFTSGSSLDEDEESDEMRNQFSLLRGATSSRKLELAEKLRKNLKQRMMLDKASSAKYLEDSDSETFNKPSCTATTQLLGDTEDYSEAVGPLMVQTFEAEEPWFYGPRGDDWVDKEEGGPMRLSREVIDMMHDRFEPEFMAQVERAYSEQWPFAAAEHQTINCHNVKRVEGQVVTENGHACAKGYLYDSLGCFLKGVEVGPIENATSEYHHHIKVRFGGTGSRTEGSSIKPVQLTPQHLHQNSEWITGWTLLTEFYGSFFLNCVGHPKWSLIVAQIKRQQQSSVKHRHAQQTSPNHTQQPKKDLTPYGLIRLFNALHLFNDTPALRSAEWADFRDIFPGSFVYEWLGPRGRGAGSGSGFTNDRSGSGESGSGGEGEEEEAMSGSGGGGCSGSKDVRAAQNRDLDSSGDRKQLERKKARARQVLPWRYKLVWLEQPQNEQQSRHRRQGGATETSRELVLMICF